ncbi:MAG: YihA family ribosome biogenesis GTP-binding protein [Burkholderiales bacterium]|nr:YihA family ribosome biogenesis GTP-binding protein [Candidatus Omnitrophota bacterium]MCB1984870.1 YihA family ribosome biogenesis GTP-binding protein [Nitrosomonas sp.]MCP5274335.1 YihA family ribosome biogenesis GTP-binding protein [Burkholderiales bacterium]
MTLFQDASFYTSVNSLKDLPMLDGVEIAFAGRSNAGKSSVINTLTRRNKLAFVSKTPGRTQQINYFRLRSGLFLVDLPGYGYAKVPIEIRNHWGGFLSEYLQTRKMLLGLVLIMDIRHPLKDLDMQMLDWFSRTQKSVHIMLTKADKLSRCQANYTLNTVKKSLVLQYPMVSVQLFSSTKATGIEEANKMIGNWICNNAAL